jgi:DNA-binding MarR family transcriptional regulator
MRSVSGKAVDISGSDTLGSDRAADVLADEWHALMTRYHRTACVLDRELQTRHDLSVSEFEILQQLFNAGDGCGSVRMQELAHEVHLTQSALSRLISRLERDGLVGRDSCTEDRRSVYVTITDAGRERFLTARPTQRAVLREQAATPV